MSAEQIGAIEPVDMAALNKSQIAAFNPEALASGLPLYLSNNGLTASSANFVAGLTNSQIGQFSAAAVNATMSHMTTAQIGSIRNGVISAIDNEPLQSLSGNQLNALKSLQIGQLSTDQLGSLRPGQVSKLSAAWLNKLSDVQIQSFAATSLTLMQLRGLDAAHVKALSGEQVAALGSAQLGVLAAKQIAAIDADDIDMMTADQFIALKQPQLKALTSGQIEKLDSAKTLTITARNIASLSYQQIQHFNDDVLTHLSGEQLRALTAKQIATGLDGRKIGLLSADQVANFRKTQIQALTYAEIAALSVEDLTALTNTQLTSFKVNQLANFTEEQIGWLIENKLDAGFTTEQLNKIVDIARLFASAPAVIDLGNKGKLIYPTLVDGGMLYYYWDRNGNGGWQADVGDADATSHDTLDAIFNRDINGNIRSGLETTDVYRYAIINGYKLALPTVGEAPAIIGLRPGTAVSGIDINATYNDYLALWDANNGSANSTNIQGAPANWPRYGHFWTATPSSGFSHAFVVMGDGNVVSGSEYGEGALRFVALQVIKAPHS